MTTVTTVLQTQREKAGRKRLRERRKEDAVDQNEVPRISRLMALAIKFQEMLREGVAKDLSELARLGRVTQPRMTQIMNLTFLAPDIQEAILDIRVAGRKNSLQLRDLQEVASMASWKDQRSGIRILLDR